MFATFALVIIADDKFLQLHPFFVSVMWTSIKTVFFDTTFGCIVRLIQCAFKLIVSEFMSLLGLNFRRA